MQTRHGLSETTRRAVCPPTPRGNPELPQRRHRRGRETVTQPRPPWSARRRRLIVGLVVGTVRGGLGAVALPAEYGVTAAFLAALCGFLVVVALVVFVTI